MADREKLKEKGKVASVRKRDVKTIFIDDYELMFPEKSFLTETGHLVVFELKRPDGPEFQARWDDRAYSIDFDVVGVGVSEDQKLRFKHSEHGCSGHHSILVPEAGGRTYHVKIVYKGNKVYEGMVSINLDYSGTAKGHFRLGGSAK
jgi:hypothetical protein